MEDLGKDFGVRDSSFCVCLFRRNRCTSLDTHTHTHTNAGTHFAISPLPLLLPNSSSPLFAVQKQSQGPILILFGGLKVFMFESNSLSSCLRVCLQAVKCYLILTIAPGQFLSSVDRNECRVSAFGAEASCGPFLSSHGLACHCCKKAFLMRLSPSQLVLSSFPL